MLSTEPAPYVMIFRCVFQNGIPDSFKCLATTSNYRREKIGRFTDYWRWVV